MKAPCVLKPACVGKAINTSAWQPKQCHDEDGHTMVDHVSRYLAAKCPTCLGWCCTVPGGLKQHMHSRDRALLHYQARCEHCCSPCVCNTVRRGEAAPHVQSLHLLQAHMCSPTHKSHKGMQHVEWPLRLVACGTYMHTLLQQQHATPASVETPLPPISSTNTMRPKKRPAAHYRDTAAATAAATPPTLPCWCGSSCCHTRVQLCLHR